MSVQFPDMNYIGTSGYVYPYWKGRFYPEKLSSSEWLSYYSILFNTIELNSTFYRFPQARNLKKAADATPADFRFTVKAHKIITHTRRMKDVVGKIKEFVDIIEEGLTDKLGCILFQLPPSYFYTEERLNDILLSLGGRIRNVVEFRHASWWNNDVYPAFRASGLSFCSVSYPGLPDNHIQTSPIFYKRMHGVPILFESAYTQNEIHMLANAIPQQGTRYIYFNNTMYEAGYSNADHLMMLMQQKIVQG